jgi:hypothetical protein
MSQLRSSRPPGPAAPALAAALSLLAACGTALPPPTPLDHGSASVRLLNATAAAGIASATLTIQPGSGGWFEPIVAQLSAAADGQWTAYVDAVPAGPGRRFAVEVRDGAGGVAWSGAAQTDVAPAATASVALMLDPGTPAVPTVDTAPVIDALTATATQVAPSQEVSLQVLAHDPDPGDLVALWWGATCGTLDRPSDVTVRWTAPDAPGACRIDITVSDWSGVAAIASLTVNVAP